MALAVDEARPPLLRIVVAHPDEVTVVISPTGEADIGTVATLRRALYAAIDGGTPHVVVDLDRLSFMDASTLGVLVEARRRSSGAGGTLRIGCHTPHHRRLLRVTGLEGLLDPED